MCFFCVVNGIVFAIVFSNIQIYGIISPFYTTQGCALCNWLQYKITNVYKDGDSVDSSKL